NRGRRAPGGEPPRLGVPEVRLPVHAAQPAGVDQGSAIEHLIPGARFAEAADDDDVVLGRQLRPGSHARSVWWLRVCPGLRPALEYITARHQLRQHYD